MAKKNILIDYDFNQNEIQNFAFQNLGSAPATPVMGQPYYDTGVKKLYIFNGTTWDDQDTTYTFSTGLTETSGVVTLNAATTSTLGGVIVGSNINVSSGTISVNSGTNAVTGVLRLATDAEASTGTAEGIAVNPKQLATKVTANAAITGATKCKITYDSKGLVTAGADLAESDIPALHLSKITDVTATAAEVNVLDGITASTTELNYVDGVTSAIQTQLDNKQGLLGGGTAGTVLTNSGTPGTVNSLAVDTTVTSSSSNLITSGAVATAIDNALVGALTYKGTWNITSATDYSGITLPVKKGYMYLVTGTGPKTIGGIEWNAGDYLVVNTDVAAGGSLVGNVDKIDNTESSDIVRLNATQTLTNKTIDADDNTIQDLAVANFKSGVVVTSVGNPGADTSIPTEKAVRSAISALKNTYTNGALTASGGVCTWTISTAQSPACLVAVYETVGGAEVAVDVTHGSGSLTIKINSASNIASGKYTAVVIG